MLRLASDEDVRGAIIRGLHRREPTLDLVRVQDVGLEHTPDPLILDWAARENRIVITEDVNTMVGFAWARVNAGHPMPGLLVVSENATIGQAIGDILLVADCYAGDEMNDQVLYLPF